ncbi:hypothetical protein SAMN04488109_2809 [Chryseolinea serpens]|uniref:Tyr recombinase domain-containing protein n=1 Tax=Chryseolinea serpens TaxID=947013 RepID=A0A1M5PCN4_9BACT|nr:DUF6538 domain-containing protein [Chryseolinea serpens]SHG99530.1 hypothetical protein SAMN04488109_2809 [Chryseolinea serpens]
MTINHHVIKRKDRYYFNRRVPRKIRDFDGREMIRISLDTDSRENANKKAIAINEKLEQYWRSLIKSGKTHSDEKFLEVIRFAKLLGFTYLPAAKLAEEAPWDNIYDRLKAVEESNFKSPLHAEALLGGIDAPVLTLDQALERFWGFTKDRVINKSVTGLRKWKNPRSKAMRNLIEVIGNKAINNVSREEVIRFRDWWIHRIENDGLKAASANKDLIHVKSIVETVNENMKLGIDTQHLFKKITLDEWDSEKRLPFETDFIVSTLLSEQTLEGLTQELKFSLFILAETGIRPVELTGLLPEDIILDHEVPHIVMRARPKRPLKTRQSARVIPLTGYALHAFKILPHGLKEYRYQSDELSTELNKFLRDRDVFPSENHSVYSLRHSFQDRLVSVDAPDRVQSELIGHKFPRPLYGSGPTLDLKLEWMKRIQLRKPI